MTMSYEEFLQSPAASPPPGVDANFQHPSNTYSYAWPAFLTVVIVANSLFFANAYVKLRIVKKLLVEDYLLFIAWLVYAFGFSTIAVLICKLPVGMHKWDMTMEKFMRHMFLFNTAFIFYGTLNILIKANILLQYIRIFVPTGFRNFTFWTSHALIWIIGVFYAIFVFLIIFACQPRKKFWDETVQGGHCLNWLIVLLVGNVVTFFSDVIIWLLPQRVIFSLSLSRAKKVGLSLLFTIGIFACICSGIRFRYTVELLTDMSDTTFILSKICFWGTCQLTAGFLVACLPAVPMLANHIQKQPWALRISSTVRSLLHISRTNPSYDSGGKPTTIGGGNAGKRMGGKVATDAEFEELVRKTDNDLSLASISQSHIRPSTLRGADSV